jgi:NitT/TauT family transport system substrate-binding protein
MTRHSKLLPAIAAALLIPLATPAVADDIIVSQWGVSLTGAETAVALGQGLFEKAGSGVTEVVSSQGGGAALRTVLAADNESVLGYAVVSLSAAVEAIRKGEDLKIVHQITSTAGDIVLLTRKDSPVSSVKDLQGKSIGITNPLGFSDMFAALAVQQAGLPIDSVKRVAMGSISGALAGLDNGAVDVTHLLEPEWTVRGNDYKLVFHGKDLPKMVQGVGVATGSLIREHPEKVRAIVLAHRLAAQSIKSDPEAAARSIAQYYDHVPVEALTKVVKDLAAIDHFSEGDFDIEAMDRMLDGLRLIGAFKGDVDWKQMLDRTFIEEVNKS